MPPLRNTLADLSDERFRTAVLLGLASIPFTVALSWESAPMSFSGEAVVVAGLLAGLHYADRSAEDGDIGLLEAVRYGKRPSVSRRAGVVAGAVGSAPAIGWEIAYTAELAWTLSGWQRAVAAVALPIVVPFLVALFGLGGGVGAAVGDWLVTRVDRTRDRARSRADSDADGDVSGWWRWVAAYLVFAPAVLLSVFAVGPENGAVFVLSALALLVLIPFAVFVAVALFEDAVTLRETGREWNPNYWTYVGVPLAAYVVVYLLATVLESANPSGDGVYGFVVALWVSAAVYLAHRRRYVGT
ncbi:transposase [Natrinema ejinorense]|uniref:Transposase n=1 Tax=Natrinema ejinorense TaxID=373386 RepID=A0A2A5R0C7_9EURY|nr:transposase [Natrinema ejinorense]PCR92483.1 transposase [Natrinema ejinorense]